MELLRCTDVETLTRVYDRERCCIAVKSLLGKALLRKNASINRRFFGCPPYLAGYYY